MEIATLSATSAGTIPLATTYINDPGTYTSQTYTNATYAVEAASGRAALTSGTTTLPVIYLTADSAFSTVQTTGTGPITFNGTGGYTVVSQTTGSITNTPKAGIIAINANGSGNLDGGNFPFVTNGNVLLAIPAAGDPVIFVITNGL